MQSVALNQLTLLNENLYNRKFKKLDKTSKMNSYKKSLYNRMMLSYFNIGVQQEHLKRYSDCEVSYNRSRIIASTINDKGILKRLTKTQSMHNAGKGTSSSLYDKSQYSNNNSKLNMNSMRSNSKDQSNYPNFSLYNNDFCEIK
jgi:hypothetical protein